jgi:MFS family permease
MVKEERTNRKITLLASLGSAFEYYDFIIYGMMATYLSAVFFPTQTPGTATLQAFLIFAVGYFARPLGGLFVGIIGDRFGRRPAFLISTSLMACSTLLIAFLPSYDTIGIVAVLLLMACRVIQGLSFGGELPGAMTIVAEFSPVNRRGRKTSLVMASTSVGALVAGGVLYFLSAMLNKEEIISWGWRLPFLLGGILGLLLFIARNTLQETPIFEAFKEQYQKNEPLAQLMKTHKFSLVRGAALTTFMAALIITNLYFPYYIPKLFSYQISDVYLGTTISLVFVIFILPLMGMVSDFFLKKIRTLQWICVSYIILSVPIFLLLLTGNLLALWAFLMIQQLYIALYAACLFPTLIRLFPPEVRYTGLALCYNATWALMATLPISYTAVMESYNTPWVVPIILSAIAGVSLLASRRINDEE